MASPLLTTKLYIPQLRPNLVSRPQLIERLNPGLGGNLTLISTPAGFGKTSLVSVWSHQSEQPITWLSLDENDNDLVSFLNYFIAALRQIDEGLGIDVLEAPNSSQSLQTEILLTMLVNDIANVEGQFSLVLDDYHLIDSQSVHKGLNYLIENLPSQLHLVITTREDPPIQISRLRSRSQLTELRAVDLRFKSSEAVEFLNQVMGLNLSETNISALEARTEGWITGLQMAAISMQGSKDVEGFIESFTGSHRYVLD